MKTQTQTTNNERCAYYNLGAVCYIGHGIFNMARIEPPRIETSRNHKNRSNPPKQFISARHTQVPLALKAKKHAYKFKM